MIFCPFQILFPKVLSLSVTHFIKFRYSLNISHLSVVIILNSIEAGSD